jgi:hypothetical protein
MRLGRIGAGLVLLMVGSVVAGCGDGVPAPQAQGEVAGPVTKPRVAAFARDVQLGASDFPGSIPVPAKKREGDDKFEAQFAKCTGSSLDLPTVAEFFTPTFYYAERDERAGFASEVRGVPTPYEAKALVSLLRSKRGFSCLERLLPENYESDDAAIGDSDTELRDVSVSRLPTQLPPTQNAWGIRIDLIEVEGDQEMRVFIDQIGFVSGPAEILLQAVGTPTPVNKNVEAGLMAILYNRAAKTEF